MTSAPDLIYPETENKQALLAQMTRWGPLIEDARMLGFVGPSISESEPNHERKILLRAFGTKDCWLVYQSESFADKNQSHTLLKRFIDRTRSLVEVSGKEISRVVERILIDGVNSVGGRCGAIYLLDKEKSVWSPIARFNIPEEHPIDLQLDEGICGHLKKTGEPFFVTGDYDSSDFCSRKLSGLFTSVAMVAIKSKGKMIGSLFIENPKKDYFAFEVFARLKPFVDKIHDTLHNDIGQPESLNKWENIHNKWSDPNNLIGNSPFAVIAVESGVISFFNWRAVELFGYDPKDVFGKSPGELYSNLKIAKAVNKILRKSELVSGYIVNGRHKSGKTFPMRLYAMRTGPNSSVGFIEDLRELSGEKDKVSLLLSCISVLKGEKDEAFALQSLSTKIVEVLKASFCGVYILTERNTFLRTGVETRPGNWEMTPSIPSDLLKTWSNKGSIYRKLHKKNTTLKKLTNIFNLPEIPEMVTIAPIVIKNKCVGFLCVGNLKEDLLFSPIGKANEEGLVMFQSIASQTAEFIDRVRLLRASDQSRLQIQAFFEAGDALIEPKPPREILARVVEHILDISGAWWVSIILANREGVFEQPIQICREEWPKKQIEIRSDGLTRRVLETGQRIIIDDLAKTELPINPKLKDWKIQAEWCLPLIIREQCIGVVWLYFTKEPTYPKSELHHLQHFANQAALSVDGSRALEQQEKTLAALETFDKAKDPDELHQAIIDALVDILGIKSAMFCLYDLKRKALLQKHYAANGGYWVDAPEWKGWALAKSKEIFLDAPITPILLQGSDIVRALFFDRDEFIRGIFLFKVLPGAKLWEREEFALKTLAKHAAFAMKRVDLITRLENTLKLAQVAAQAGTQGSVKSTLSATAREICNRLKADLVVISVFDSTRDRVRDLIFVRLPDRDKTGTLGFLKDDEQFQLELMKGGFLWIENRNQPKGKIKEAMVSQGFNSFASLPLRFDGNFVGWLGLFYDEAHVFEEDERSNIQLIANLVATTVKSALLHQINTRQASHVATIQKLGREAITSLDREELLTLLARRGKELVSVESGGGDVSIWIGKKGSYQVIDAKNDHGKAKKFCGHDVDASIIQRCIDSQENVLDFSMPSKLAVPILAGEETIGAFYATHPEAKAFDEGLIMALEVIATQASIAIQSARFYGNLRRMGGMVGSKTALEWLSMVGATWGHNIHREAATARQKIELLKRKLKGKLDEKYTGYLSSLDKHFTSIKEMPLLAPLTGEEEITEFDLIDWLVGHIDRLKKGEFQAIAFKKDFPKRPVIVEASKNWLYRLFEIIFENGKRVLLKYHIEDPGFEIIISTDETGTIVRVKNNGPKIEPHIAEKMFENIIKKEEGGHGAGIGLVLARTIAQTYGGHLYARKDLENGAEFVLTLPPVPGK
ncbi:MAG: GAF domain-containing protein [Acidobacteriota bacterium]|nr:GAF domain-containing protein [Acidobacteriota bacterium]